ncbi:MAG: VanZ family protein [Gemmatimonadetes bacterium]|nr:VanZ family protein [Gemmatimonadota bacterium]
MIDTLIAWGPAAAWAVVLFLLSGQGDLPSPLAFPYGDKLAHLGLYTVLGALLAWGGRSRGSAAQHERIILVGVFYGATDEVHQLWVVGRSASLTDFLVDAVGVTLGYAILQRFWLARALGSTGRSLPSG